MNRILYPLICVTLLYSNALHAKGGAQLLHGGYGFLFPDGNSFSNPGQMALSKGAAIEGYYARTNIPKAEQLTPSFVWGNGRFGMGAYLERVGTMLSGNSRNFTDTVGAALGMSLAQERITLGVGGERSISARQTSDGTVNAAINYNGAKRVGLTMGVGGSTTLNRAVRNIKTGKASLGWAFSQYSNIEGQYAINDFDASSSNTTISGFLNVGSPHLYLGTGYSYLKLTTASQVMARLGLLLGALDFSVHAEHVLKTGQNPVYGGTLRMAF